MAMTRPSDPTPRMTLPRALLSEALRLARSPLAVVHLVCGLAVDWQHLFGRFREGQPRFPELDRRHVAQRRVDPEVVVPVHVVRELGP